MRARIGKDIKIRWAVLTDGSALPLVKEELTLDMTAPNGRTQSMEFEVEGNVLTATFYGKDQNYTGDYMLTLWKNKGKEGQSVVDKTSAFSLVRYTPQEDPAQKHDNLSATLADLGDTSLVTIDGASETTLVCNLTGYKAVEDVGDLPMEPSTIGYLVGDNLYVYVGEGGDVRLGAYKNCGPFRGLKGDTGAQGPQGNSGYQGAVGELQVVNNLTEGGEAAALSAEQGKVLDEKKQDKLQTYHETEGYENASVGVENVFHVEASCGDKDTRSALLIVDKDETEVAEERTAMLYTENDTTGNGNYIQAGKEAVLLKSSKPGTASEVQVSPEKISMSSPSVEIEDVVGTIKELVDYMATDKTDDEQINVTLNQHEARFEELTNSVQMLRDETEDLQSMREAIDTLDTEKADKSALEDTNKEVAKKQDILEGYREYPSKGAVEISGQEKASMSVDYHENIAEVSTYYEDNWNNGVVPVVRIESTYESGDYAYVETRGNEVNIVGDYVTVNGADLMQTIEDVATLNGTGEGSVSKTVTDEIAKVVANAPADFDTLKEIADYIASDKTNAAEINNTLTALKTRIYDLGDFGRSGQAEAEAGKAGIAGNPDIVLIRYTVGNENGIILQQVGGTKTKQILFWEGTQFQRHINFSNSDKTSVSSTSPWWKMGATHTAYDATTRRLHLQDMNYINLNPSIDAVLPLATETQDGLMTKAQVQSLEGKQDALANYKEESSGKTTIKQPNGTARVEVSKVRAALWANDNKAAIAADANGTRMLYNKTGEDGVIEHRDEISIGRHDDSSATHITLTSKSTTEEAGEKLTSTSTIQVNPERISMSSPNGEIGDVVKEISGKASSESVSKLRQEVEEVSNEVNEKAPKVGYAPDLKVNFAKELVGRGESTSEVIGGIRPTGVRSIGDGNATITKVRGNSVVWNQCMNITDAYPQMDRPLYTITHNDDKYHVVKQEGGTATGDNIYMAFAHDFKNGHKYLSRLNIRRNDGQNPGFEKLRFGIYDGTSYQNNLLIQGQDYAFFSFTSSFTSTLLQISQSVTAGVALSYTIAPVIYDLTQMFGAGNEPTTIEDFEARKPLGVGNEYNEGTIVSFQGGDVKSVGFNAWDEEWEEGIYDIQTGKKISKVGRIRAKNLIKVIPNTEYYVNNKYWQYVVFYDKDRQYIGFKFFPTRLFITPDNCAYIATYAEDEYGSTYKNDVCINLSHSEYRNGEYEPYEDDVHPLPNISAIKDADGNQLFPYGMLSAGSVHDEITATKAIKRVGVVDMGMFGWRTNRSFNCWVIEMPNDYKHGTLSVGNCVNKKYPVEKYAIFTNSSTDKVLSGNNKVALFVRDSSYTSADEFKQAMSGVLLYYELAEPIEVDLPEPLNMTYEAWDFGTEELVAKGATTPLNADIVYQFNAVDRIRENSSAIEDLEGHVEERKDDGIELLTNGNLKLTLKGETREFMPATPSGDPMHYAYVSAGAEYNATTDYILKNTPWKDMVDTIEDKAKWGLDVVDASNVKQMAIGGVSYNYATENRTSPEGGTYLRYFLVGQGSNGVWVEDETKVLHLPKCWYLNGLGDITNVEMLRCYEESPKNVGNYVNQQFGKWSKARTLKANASAYSLMGISYLFVNNANIEVPNINWSAYDISSVFYKATKIRYSLNIRFPKNPEINGSYCNTAARISGAFSGATSLRGCFLSGLVQSVSFSDCGNISKPSILHVITKASPTSAITITLHADAYARLAEDADIVAALEAKPLVTLVSA